MGYNLVNDLDLNFEKRLFSFVLDICVQVPFVVLAGVENRIILHVES